MKLPIPRPLTAPLLLAIALISLPARGAPFRACGELEVRGRLECDASGDPRGCRITAARGSLSETVFTFAGLPASAGPELFTRRGLEVSARVRVERAADPRGVVPIAELLGGLRPILPDPSEGGVRVLRAAGCQGEIRVSESAAGSWPSARFGAALDAFGRFLDAYERGHPVEIASAEAEAVRSAFAALWRGWLNEAQAYEVGDACLALGFVGQWRMREGARSGACLVTDRAELEAARAGCSAGALPCAPGVFGVGEGDRPFCVPRGVRAASAECRRRSAAVYRSNFARLAADVRRLGQGTQLAHLSSAIAGICDRAGKGPYRMASDVRACRALREDLARIRSAGDAPEAPKPPEAAARERRESAAAECAVRAGGPRNVALVWGGNGEPRDQNIFWESHFGIAAGLRREGWEVEARFDGRSARCRTSREEPRCGNGPRDEALNCCTDDRKPAFHVDRLAERLGAGDAGEATVRGFVEFLEEQSRKLCPGDQLFVSIMTHGSPGGPTGDGHYMSAADGHLSTGNPRVREALRRLREERGVRIGVSDSSCFSGATMRSWNGYGCILASTGENVVGWGDVQNRYLARLLEPRGKGRKEAAERLARLAITRDPAKLTLEDLWLGLMIAEGRPRGYNDLVQPGMSIAPGRLDVMPPATEQDYGVADALDPDHAGADHCGSCAVGLQDQLQRARGNLEATLDGLYGALDAGIDLSRSPELVEGGLPTTAPAIRARMGEQLKALIAARERLAAAEAEAVRKRKEHEARLAELDQRASFALDARLDDLQLSPADLADARAQLQWFGVRIDPDGSVHTSGRQLALADDLAKRMVDADARRVQLERGPRAGDPAYGYYVGPTGDGRVEYSRLPDRWAAMQAGLHNALGAERGLAIAERIWAAELRALGGVRPESAAAVDQARTLARQLIEPLDRAQNEASTAGGIVRNLANRRRLIRYLGARDGLAANECRDFNLTPRASGTTGGESGAAR